MQSAELRDGVIHERKGAKPFEDLDTYLESVVRVCDNTYRQCLEVSSLETQIANKRARVKEMEQKLQKAGEVIRALEEEAQLCQVEEDHTKAQHRSYLEREVMWERRNLQEHLEELEHQEELTRKQGDKITRLLAANHVLSGS